MRPLAVRPRVLVAHPARPIGRIGDEILQRREVLRVARIVERRPDVGRQLHEAADERIVPNRIARAVGRSRIGPGRPADCLEPAELRTDDEKTNPAGDATKVRIVQDHPPIGPIVQIARVGHRQIDRVLGELPDCGRAEEGVHRACGGARNVGRIGDAAAPGKPRPRSQEEGIEDDLEASRLQVLDAADDRRV